MFSFGFGQQSIHYGQIDDIDLENGDLTFVFQHNNCCGPNANPGELTDLTPDFERDLLEQKVGIDIDRNVFATVLEHGLADRIDLGVVVPFVKLDMHTRVFSRILRTATPPTEAEERGNAIPIHAFDPLGLSDRTTYARRTPAASATSSSAARRTSSRRKKAASRSRPTSACRPATKKI